MAKKIVRGITDVKTINNQDYDTNNVNDLLSDGEYNYIHRKKGKNEEYHNLTDNIKTISSDNTELLSVTNNNKTTNTATLHPKHDAQKEQLLESTRDTITINHGTNGTAEKTTVDVNFDKVQAKLTAGDGLSIDNNRINIKPTLNGNPLNNGFYRGILIGDNLPSSVISLQLEDNRIVQIAFRESGVTPNLMIMRYRFVKDGAATDWKLASIDNEQLLTLLSQKQDKLTAGDGITIEGQTVDTNPKKVLEHENLISDSEYITLNHQSGENVTHIKTAALKQELNNLHQTKQDTLTAGSGITIQGNTISASAPVEGASVSIQDLSNHSHDFIAVKHVVTIGQKILTTFSFECYSATAEIVLTGEIKEELAKFIGPGYSVSNGALSISHEVDVMKLLNNTPEYHNNQQATFTFYENTAGGGGGAA